MTDAPIDTHNAKYAAPEMTEADYYRRAYRDLLRGSERDQRALWHFQYFELQIVRSQGLKPLMSLLLRQSIGYFGMDEASLLLLDQEDTLRAIFAESLGTIPDNLGFTTDESELQAQFPGGVKVRALSQASILAAPDPEQGPQTTVLLPLVSQGQLVGSLRLSSSGGAQLPSSDRLSHFAAVVAVCIENCSNRERLRMHSLIDALTGVQNRRGFEESLQNEVARALRSGMPLSAMFVDLDHFKQVNDRYGHPCGDRVLAQIASNIGDMLRPTDLLSRYGGDEFVALLPACDDAQARGIAQRINLSVAALNLYDDNGEEFELSCSIGYSCWLDPGPDVEAAAMGKYLIAQADKALYCAKQEGRDRACYVTLDNIPSPGISPS